MGHSETLAPLLPRRVDVDADDHVSASKPQALDDIEPNAAESEHDTGRAGLHLGRVENGADPRSGAAADVADLVEGSVLANLGDRELGQHGEIRESGRAHIVVQLLAIEREARSAVRHHALSLCGPDGST